MSTPKIKIGGPVSADRLKSFIDRIEKLEEERRAVGSDVRDVYSEAKGVGYDVKTMRKVVALRKMDAADRAEQETLLDLYQHALGMAVSLVRTEGLSLREAERQTGVSKSSIHRALTVPAVSQPKAEPSASTWRTINAAVPERPLQGRASAPSEPTGPAAPVVQGVVKADAVLAPVGGTHETGQGPGAGNIQITPRAGAAEGSSLRECAAAPLGAIEQVKDIARAMGGERLTLVVNGGPAQHIDLTEPAEPEPPELVREPDAEALAAAAADDDLAIPAFLRRRA